MIASAHVRRAATDLWLARIVLARIVLARIILARIVLARIVLACIILACIVLAGCDPAPASIAGGSNLADVPLQMRLHQEGNWCTDRLSILIDFSQPMQTASVRQALSINPPIERRLRWNSSATQLTVEPTQGWENLTTYRLQISDTARSMSDQAPARSFETVCRSEYTSEAPAVMAVESVDGKLSPAEQAIAAGTSLMENSADRHIGERIGEHIGERIDEHIGEHSAAGDAIRITFSAAMKRDTVERALSITPPLSAMLAWPTDKIVLFRPSDEFTIGRSYYLTISTDASDQTANPLAHSFLLKFGLSVGHLRLLRIHLQGDRQIDQFLTAEPIEIASRNPLVDDYTFVFDFNQPFAAERDKNEALRHISLRNITRNGLPFPGRRSFTWVGDSSLSLTYYGIAPSTAELRNYLMLTISGGAHGLRDSLGGYLEQDIRQLFLVEERMP